MSQKTKKPVITSITPVNPKPASKKSQMVSLLERPEGVSLAELEKVTGWQPHSVRGALVHLKNKDKLPVTNTVTDSIRRYRITKADATA